MLINEHTKIAALIKHHPDALEAIVSLCDDFKKLRNPLLRKLMAGRTSIAMASKIGGCKPGDFYERLRPLGFEYGSEESLPTEKETKIKLPPAFLSNINPEQIVEFDVRAILSGGVDPLRDIQQKVKLLKPGQVLQIINTFEPAPLITLLEKQGFQSFTSHLKEDLVETYFYRENSDKTVIDFDADANIAGDTEISGDWEQIIKRYGGKLQEIDVRHLEMPMPMMIILEALEKLANDNALYVRHKRIPVFLLSELKERGFEYRIKEASENEVYLLIFR